MFSIQIWRRYGSATLDSRLVFSAQTQIENNISRWRNSMYRYADILERKRDRRIQFCAWITISQQCLRLYAHTHARAHTCTERHVYLYTLIPRRATGASCGRNQRPCFSDVAPRVYHIRAAACVLQNGSSHAHNVDRVTTRLEPKSTRRTNHPYASSQVAAAPRTRAKMVSV